MTSFIELILTRPREICIREIANIKKRARRSCSVPMIPQSSVPRITRAGERQKRGMDPKLLPKNLKAGNEIQTLS
jgi:hypothetical protein